MAATMEEALTSLGLAGRVNVQTLVQLLQPAQVSDKQPGFSEVHDDNIRVLQLACAGHMHACMHAQ